MIAHTPAQARKVDVNKSKLKGILGFGADNLFPQQLLSVVNDSVTARACVSVRSRFIEGNGLTSLALAKLPVHRSGATLDMVLSKIAANVGMFEAFALHVSYNGLGQIVGMKHVPVELCRLGEPDGFGIIAKGAICPYINSDLFKNKRKDFTELDLFNPDPVVVMSQIEAAGGIDKYRGQLIYESMWAPGDEYYHVPSYFAAIKDIETEAELSLYDYKTVVNGFAVSGFFGFVANEPLGREDHYNPANDPTSPEYQLAQNQGNENAGAIVTLRAKSAEELKAMQFVPTTGTDLSNRYSSTNERIQARIARSFNVPNELLNIRREGGIAPTGDEIKTASSLMQQSANPYQRRITEVLTRVLRYWKTPITEPVQIENLNYFVDDNATAVNAG